MLNYHVRGPDADGIYSLAYATPGAPQVITIAGASRSKALVDAECDRLNELQIADRRRAIRDKANRMSSDLQHQPRGA